MPWLLRTNLTCLFILLIVFFLPLEASAPGKSALSYRTGCYLFSARLQSSFSDSVFFEENLYSVRNTHCGE
jgi:hypothetical protein